MVSGEVEASFYNNDRNLVKKTTLRGGDALLQLSGGHSFRILKEARIIEVKQGPYCGNEKEKEYLDE